MTNHEHHSHEEKHEHGHGHPQGHQHGAHKRRGVHKDWRLWIVVLMLIAMGIYVLSDNEALQPGGKGEAMPAAPAPAAP
ncbi:MAG TPA: hypothetical protein VGG64_30070 [Pirellulales bacterium]|jgi:hypothetical protein